METGLAVFNTRELEILAQLGFNSNEAITVKGFLKTIIMQNRPGSLHDKGISLRSVRDMLKKIDPNDEVLLKKQQDFLNDEEIERIIDSCCKF
jgi:hypothetical protein